MTSAPPPAPRADPPTPKARPKQKRARQSPQPKPPPSPAKRHRPNPPPRRPAPKPAKPSSPTTSSRSKKSRRSDPPPNVLTATSPRRAPRRRAALLTVDAHPIPPPRRVPAPARLFGHEIQCLMHAFGEVRYCSRPVLELVEDTVRAAVQRVARAATAARAIRFARLAAVLARSPHATARLNTSLKPLDAPRVPHHPAPWEALLPDPRPTDVHAQLSWRALHAFRAAMGPQMFQEFAACRAFTFVKSESRSRAPRVRGVARAALFREWLGIADVDISEEALHALGHIAWETVGTLTQTALMVRYTDDLARGVGDPRAPDWGYARHLLAAVAYGLGTGIMVPLTDLQAAQLRVEIDAYMSVTQAGGNRWRGYTCASTPCLLVNHVKEAMRRLERSHDTLFATRGSVLLDLELD